MKQKDNNLTPVILLLAVILFGISALAYISLFEEREEEEVEVPLPPHMYSSSQQVIGTGNKLGTYYPAGRILTEWFNAHLDSEGGSFVAYETNGSADNIQLLQSKRIDLGMAESRVVKEAYENNPNLRIVWPLWLDVVQILKPPAHLVPNYVFPGKIKGFVGQKNSSTARTTTEILEALGFRGRHSVNIPNHLVINTISEGRLGFAMIQAGVPNQNVSDALNFGHCGLVSFTPEQIGLVCRKVETAMPFTIPSGYYTKRQEEVYTLGLPNVLVASTDSSPELIEFVTGMIVDGCPRLKAKFKAFDSVPSDVEQALKILEETAVPVHEGTKCWLEKNRRSVHKEGDKN